MTKYKKRILWMGEATFLSTGYSVYGRELLNRLYDTGQYEIAELGCYSHYSDSRINSVPWKFYACLPDSKEQHAAYEENTANQWGAWRFEEVCLDFNPDYVLDIRDWWMFSFVDYSPFRNMFNWLIMPTIDSAPQMETWLSTYLNADSIFTYSEFGKKTLEKQCGGGIEIREIASPSADYSIFKPVPDKKEHKENMGIMGNVKIIGTVMRNQKRKLYPDLIEAFKIFINKYPDTSKDTYLYLHTAYPDIGWDIPLLIKESGIGHRILCTYACQNCGHVFPSFFNDALATCPQCDVLGAKMPSTSNGISREALSSIMNCFDLYVQYSTCEGFGMPIVEAAACGIPIAAVDYSAMSSILKNIGGYGVQVSHLFRESETHAYRAYPDNEDLANKMNIFFSGSEATRIKRGRDTYLACRKHYDWDKTFDKWKKQIDGMYVKDVSWGSPIRVHEPELHIPSNMSNDEFVRWAIINIWGEPSMVTSYVALRMIRDLNYGEAVSNYGGIYYSEDSLLVDKPRYRKFTRDNVINELLKFVERKNYWEQRRVGLIKESVPSYIERANSK